MKAPPAAPGYSDSPVFLIMATSPRLYDLRTEHLVNPLGLDETAPRFSWKLADTRTGAAQTAYQIEVSAADAVVWDSRRIDGDTSVLVPYAGPSLRPHTRYHWRIRVWDHTGAASAWSKTVWFETGFLDSKAAWPAEWIGLQLPAADLQPVRHLRKTFRLAAAPRSARLYVTARGLFEPYVNGERIGNEALVPGWTDFAVRIEYLTYDVTAQLGQGDNALGALLADGWYAGYLGWDKAGKGHRYYGDEPALFAALRIEHDDGSVEWIGTDSSWRGATGPLLHADLYNGEAHDARLDLGDWSAPAFPAKGWKAVKPLAFPPVALNGKAFGPVRAIEELKPLKITEPVKGRHVFDFGQNMVGVARLRIRAPRGTRITLRFAEMLQADGTLYTENLRSARATDTYVAGGKGIEVWQPRFTFHGFRYVELTGLKTKPRPDAVTGVVLHTDMETTGSFTTSHPLVNQLQSNIRWGQRGNFLEIPTDCPQRDERLGWTGDAQVFIPTAAFNYDVASFFRKWTRDLADDQLPDGAYPDVAPDLLALMYPGRTAGNAAWADAGVICPWIVYRKYGDTRILGDNYPAMVRWIDYQEKTSDGLIRPDTAYGDWLAPDATTPSWAATPCDLIGTAYFARTAELMAKIARVLGRSADATRFAKLHARILAAFNRHFVTADARLAGDTQTAYLLALGFDLLPEKKRPAALSHLERTLKRRNDHLCTGFVGTPLLCPVLSRFGRTDLAYKLLFNEGYPSWFFPIKNGATTMWERWNSWTPEQGFGEVGMNSFNHYAYGAIGEWLYGTVAGIHELAPGFKRILLRPQPHDRLTSATATLESPHGEIRSAWKRARAALTWTVTVPPNTTAVAVPPCESLDNVRITNKSWRDAEGVSATTHEGRPALGLAAGHYTFKIP